MPLYSEMLDRLRHLPGVISASVSSNTPLSGGIVTEPVAVNGQPFTKESVHLNTVSPRYFETMGMPFALGCDFDEGAPSGTNEAIVNGAFVRRYFSGVNPIRQRVGIPRPPYPEFQIVGVVKDSVSQSLREAAPPAVYLSYFDYSDSVVFATFELRVTGSFARTAGLVREAVRAQFPNNPGTTQVLSLDEQVQRTLTQERLLAALGAAFGVLALVLSAVGLYGLLAYAVARSTNEIGIRMALGAQCADALTLVFRNALRLLAFGVVLGIPAAWAGCRLIASMLFGLTATDPLTFAAATALLAATASLAAFLPALRASRIDPMVALRYE